MLNDNWVVNIRRSKSSQRIEKFKRARRSKNYAMTFSFKAKLCDNKGNEMIVKPGHCVLIGKEYITQVPVLMYEAKWLEKQFEIESVTDDNRHR